MTPLAFVVAYAMAVIALIPASPLTIVGGALFGVARGAVYSLAGAILGSAGAFLIARYVARDLVARRVEAMPRVLAVERAVSEKGRRVVFLLRLSPVVPFNVLNYVLGLTRISLADFLIGGGGTIPGTVTYAYAGHVAGEAMVAAGKARLPHNASYYGLLIAGLGATIAVTVVVGRTARQALRDV